MKHWKVRGKETGRAYCDECKERAEKSRKALAEALKKDPLTSFQSRHWDGRKKAVVETTHVVNESVKIAEIKRVVRKGWTVILDGVGYDVDAGVKKRYPHHGTERQDAEVIEFFPWEKK
jgi:hypothetical protein